jgi:hypothetical protein
MAIRRPPQHAADAAPLFIASTDDAWDSDLIKRERADLKNHNGARHPIDVYYSGESRYDLDAAVPIGGQAITPRFYLRDGATPTIFRLRRDASMALRRSQAIAVYTDPRAWAAALWDLARHGVRDISEAAASWDLEGGGPRPLSDADMQTLHDLGDGILQALGIAVLHANAPLSDTEGKL